MGGRFKKEPHLPQSKGLRLPRDLETVVGTLATDGQTTRSDVLRELVVEALAGRAGRAKTVEEILKIVVNATDQETRRTQALSTIEQEAIVRVEHDVVRLGATLTARLDRIEGVQREADRHLTELALVVAEVVQKIPSQYNRLQGVLEGLKDALEQQATPGRIMQRLDEMQSLCEGVHDQLATLASGGEDGR